ncbi:hypothetical protein GCK72_012505 [Caenorhabditis remanei]|uniref:Uncharacterized protein n=1 Tax=Caenorhabditis remanei TaxID=31234 RepID=A0A6A5GNJ7_CAERE|nr:hypothetical protein GCK72_012505 [Caenorhabditis remanei]KAF1756052.1 hypothetical protein GCK72_012505 [Caenorhabditis remanei]
MIKILFESNRLSKHFNRIWLHIATFTQATIITHLLKSEAEQFKTYVIEISTRVNAQTSGSTVLNAIQTEYEQKFRVISDVLNFLMRKRNSQSFLDSLDSKPKSVGGEKPAITSSRVGFAFLFELVTCWIKLCRSLYTMFYVTNNGNGTINQNLQIIQINGDVTVNVYPHPQQSQPTAAPPHGDSTASTDTRGPTSDVMIGEQGTDGIVNALKNEEGPACSSGSTDTCSNNVKPIGNIQSLNHSTIVPEKSSTNAQFSNYSTTSTDPTRGVSVVQGSRKRVFPDGQWNSSFSHKRNYYATTNCFWFALVNVELKSPNDESYLRAEARRLFSNDEKDTSQLGGVLANIGRLLSMSRFLQDDKFKDYFKMKLNDEGRREWDKLMEWIDSSDDQRVENDRNAAGPSMRYQN